MVGFMEGGHCSRGILKRWLLRSGCSLSSPSLISGPALNEACNQAAHGTVLAVCELPAMAQGRDLVARRLKANSARWKVRRVNRMARLCAIRYSRQWDDCWKTVAP